MNTYPQYSRTQRAILETDAFEDDTCEACMTDGVDLTAGLCENCYHDPDLKYCEQHRDYYTGTCMFCEDQP